MLTSENIFSHIKPFKENTKARTHSCCSLEKNWWWLCLTKVQTLYKLYLHFTMS